MAWSTLTVEVAGYDRADGLVEAVFACGAEYVTLIRRNLQAAWWTVCDICTK